MSVTRILFCFYNSRIQYS